MDSEEIIIHIDWDGPHNLNTISSLVGTTDYGIYQVYGAHHVYGSDVLLYIGQANDQNFATRLSQHGWFHSNQDKSRLQIYVGRLFNGPGSTPTSETWRRYITLAERLLIYAHSPAGNTQKNLSHLEPDLRRVHVLNWRHYRDLLPEVSGKRWTDHFDEVPYEPHFDTDDYAKKADQITK